MLSWQLSEGSSFSSQVDVECRRVCCGQSLQVEFMRFLVRDNKLKRLDSKELER